MMGESRFDDNRYFGELGKLVSEYHNLEFTIRLVLTKAEPNYSKELFAPLYRQLSSGEWVPETPLTNRDSLDELIKKFNKLVKPIRADWQVDASIVGIRDIIAHGRVFSNSHHEPQTILKFRPPEKAPGTEEKRVQVEF